MDQILAKLESIEARLTQMEARLTAIETSTDHMDEHIGFVHQVYEVVRMPFAQLFGAAPALRSVRFEKAPEKDLSVEQICTEEDLNSWPAPDP
uniref:Uncharacterized protein n=1 Tax=viral metagenome TaxID=1070528 RepID=A0A6C0BNB7_9ZZZZ